MTENRKIRRVSYLIINRPFWFSLLLVLGVVFSCARQDFDLPDLEYSGGFSSHEIYNRVQPDIMLSDSCGANDIFIGEDGTVFVAETALNRIGVYDIMGLPLMDYGLGSLLVDSVISVAVDRMMNLLAVNGSSQLFYWNQLLHTVPVDSVHYDFVLRDTTQVDSLLPVDLIELGEYLFVDESDHFVLDSYQRATTAAEVEEMLAMQVYETSQNTNLIDVSPDPDQPYQFFATDNARNRIFQFHFAPVGVAYSDDVLLPELLLWRIVPEATHHVVEFGTGFGYANKPNRIHVDADGDFYFSNFSDTGSDFQLHKTLRVEQGDGSFAYYPDNLFLFDDQTGDIRDLFDTLRFEDCWDMTTSSNNIFVVDRGYKYSIPMGKSENAIARAGAVQVFSSGGEFITYAGAEIQFTEDGEVYEFGELIDPVSVDYFGGEEVEEDINALLFVLDRGSDRIVRYERTLPAE
jgi:hypothetical protein